MTQQEALQQMINYLDLANRRGAFNLKESQAVANAVDAFAPQEEKPTMTREEVSRRLKDAAVRDGVLES
jgi:hypothetical protein